MMRAVIASSLTMCLLGMMPAPSHAREDERKAACAALPRPQMRATLALVTEFIDEAGHERIRRLVAETWRAEGIDLQWARLTAPVMGGGNGLLLLGRHHTPILEARVLGLVTFERGLPSPIVHLSISNIVAWVKRAEQQHFGIRRPPGATFVLSYSRSLLERAIAYAAAHEIGHYVLASNVHRPEGLMRQALDNPHLLLQGHPNLDPHSRAALAARLADGQSCP